MMKLQPKEVKRLAQGHTVRNGKAQVQVQVWLVLKFPFFHWSTVSRKRGGLRSQIFRPSSARSPKPERCLKAVTFKLLTAANSGKLILYCDPVMHTHTHTHIPVCISVYVCICVCLPSNNVHCYSEIFFLFFLMFMVTLLTNLLMGLT